MDLEYHFIGDIHGHASALDALLRRLGHRPRDGVFEHPEARVVFLGDFIDRGPEQRRVIDIVRPMVESGSALAVMGNHEFNSIAWHSRHPDTGEPLRSHNEKNRRQHQAFLDAFPEDHPDTRAVIDWFRTLPLYLRLHDDQGRERLRAVHACWHADTIARTPRQLDEKRLIEASTPGHPTFDAIECLLKGPEIPLPAGVHFHDKDSNRREHIRVRWWDQRRPASYRGIAMLPEATRQTLPEQTVPDHLLAPFDHAPEAPPVFFGHYWLAGRPAPLAPNAACLDYSVARGGALTAYRWHPDDTGPLRAERFVSVPAT